MGAGFGRSAALHTQVGRRGRQEIRQPFKDTRRLADRRIQELVDNPTGNPDKQYDSTRRHNIVVRLARQVSPQGCPVCRLARLPRSASTDRFPAPVT